MDQVSPTAYFILAFISLVVVISGGLYLLDYCQRTHRRKHVVQIHGCLDESHLPEGLQDQQNQYVERFPSVACSIFFAAVIVLCWSGLGIKSFVGTLMKENFSTVTQQLNVLNAYSPGEQATGTERTQLQRH
jgi:hypothetical protein